MARALRRLLPHEYLELNDYMRMISRYPVMDHVEFDRRVRAFLPVQRELIELEKELEPYRENDEDPPPELYQRYLAILQRRNSLREPLVRGNLRLAITALHSYVGRGLSVMDLIQEGQLGVVRALERFDPERGLRFSTYAMWWVRARMRFAMRECNSFRAFDLPHHVQEQYGILVRVSGEFRGKHGRMPSADELLVLAHDAPTGEAKRISKKLVRRFLEEPGFGSKVPLDARVNPDDEDSAELIDLMADGRPKPEQLVAAREMLDEHRKELAWIMGHLPGNDERHAVVLRARFGYGEFAGGKLTLEEVGQKLDLTRERIRQLEAVALQRKGVDREEVEVLIESIAELETQLAALAA